MLNAVLTGCLLFSLNACEREQNSESNADLSAALESLEKELGRLEYRVYLLENPDAEGTAADDSDARPDQSDSD